MKSSLIFVLFVILFSSCNVVKMRENATARKLERKEITEYYFQTDSLKIKYWKGGAGPAILFIHGFGGDALLSWDKEMRHFAKTHTVIAADLLWFGESATSLPANLTTQRLALSKLLDHLKVEKVMVIGQSYGGFLAIDLAMNEPTRVTKLCVANCPGTTFNVKELDKVTEKYKVHSIDNLFVFNEPQNVQRLLNLSTYSDPKIPKFALKQAYDMYFNQNHSQLIQLLQTLPGEQSRFKEFALNKRIPTLVLWGEYDEIFSFSEGKLFAESIGAEFISIPNCGHVPQVDAPKVFEKILANFFNN